MKNKKNKIKVKAKAKAKVKKQKEKFKPNLDICLKGTCSNANPFTTTNHTLEVVIEKWKENKEHFHLLAVTVTTIEIATQINSRIPIKVFNISGVWDFVQVS